MSCLAVQDLVTSPVMFTEQVPLPPAGITNVCVAAAAAVAPSLPLVAAPLDAALAGLELDEQADTTSTTATRAAPNRSRNTSLSLLTDCRSGTISRRG